MHLIETLIIITILFPCWTHDVRCMISYGMYFHYRQVDTKQLV